MVLVAGGSVASRKLDFNVRDGVMNGPAAYEGPVVGGIYATGEIYPLAFQPGQSSLLRNLGVSFVFDRVLKLESAVDDGMDGVVNLPTSQTRYGLGARYRLNLGSSPTSPSLVMGAGYNKLTFEIDRGAAPGAIVDLPNTDYTYLDPGLTLRVPVGDKLAFTVDARLMLFLDAGEIQDPEQYGRAVVTGFDADAAADYRLSERFFVRVGLHLTAVGFDFKGTGEKTDLNGDEQQDVGGAFDRYLGIYAALGFIY
jgi:hypothetical protein